ncbi:hypothetical protein ACFQZ4_03045 [Catellatospora coxensis]
MAAVLAVLLTATAVLSAVPAAAATPVSVSGAHWIWYPEGDPRTTAPAATRYFRKTFAAPSGTVTDAQLVVTGDDTVDVWLNGKPSQGRPGPSTPGRTPSTSTWPPPSSAGPTPWRSPPGTPPPAPRACSAGCR